MKTWYAILTRSSNANAKAATKADTITVAITAAELIQQPTVLISDTATTVSPPTHATTRSMPMPLSTGGYDNDHNHIVMAYTTPSNHSAWPR